MTNLIFKKSRLLLSVLMLLSLIRANGQQSTNLINAQLTVEREKYGLTADDISDYLISNQYTDEVTGLTYAYIQQRHNKVAVYNAISVFLIKDNKVVYFKPGMIDHLAQKVKTASPNITPEAAIGYALMNIGRNEIAPVKLINTDNNLKTFTYESPSISSSPIKVQLVYRAMDDGIYLAWDVSIELKNEPHWWNIRIDALTGNYLDKNDWTVNCSFDDPNDFCSLNEHEAFEPASQFSPLPPPPPLGEYNVYPFPLEAPSFGGRSILINPEDPTSSPFGWHDVDGVVGNEYTITRGNNVHAYEDANNDNLPGYSPNSATLQFNYPVDLTQAPIVNQDASITNLFYLNNRIHDVLYHAGFNEAGGNFQQNNYGNGGLGNDYVQAEAFDGSGTNNANFGTPADGSRPRMQMYLWTAPNPDRDGSFDNGIVAHEYGHGVSNRLTGGPSNSSCLGNAEQGGEGWSDWLALIMTIEPGDTVAGGMLTQARGIGTYALNQATSGQGIRRFRYSVNMAINPQTYADLATSGSGPHNKGEIWCDAIWDMTCFLVNDLGFNSNPTIATAGNNIAMRLVLEGMKLQPCSPGFLNARDAILSADAILYGNAHRCRIWEAFARRGMGFSAVQGSSNSSTDQTAAFDMPVFCLTATQPPVAAFTSNVSTIPCAGTVQFTDASTQAFTSAWNFGDGGTSILTNPTHQFTSPGTYNVKLVVTNPLGTDSVTHPITVTSIFSANLTATPNPVSCGSSVQLNAVGSGSTNYNYALTTIPFAPVSGTPTAGPAGDDIVSSFIPIGFNFPFYNTVQTQLKISTNGFISFNSNSGSGCCAGAALPNNSSTLSNLIAVAWTDLYVGSPNSIDYFNLTSPNRFVIRFNAVSHCCATTPAQVTAQIILYQTGEIEMHNTSILTGGDVMTMGIENANGTIATVVPGRNASNFTASNEGYRFTPSINYTYNWQPGNLNGASQTVSPIANTTYTVYVADGSGCVQPFNTPLVNVTPIIANISGNLSFCSGSSTILDAGAGYAGYSWSTGATTRTISINTAGSYSVTVTNGSGCTGTSASVSTIVNPLPTPSITGALAFCSGGSTTLDAGAGYAGYSWSTGATSQTISPNAAGTFTVTVTNGNGCTGTSASVSTIVNPLPTPTITGALAFCSGGSTTLDAGGGYAGYSWSTGATSQTISPNAAGTFTVTVTNGSGCTGTSASVSTIVNPLPTPTITGALAFCSGGSTTLDAGAGYSSYSWTGGATSQTISVSTAGNVSVTVTNGSNCTGSASLTTVVNPLPNVTASNVSGCAGSTIALAGSPAGGTWSVANPYSGASTTYTHTFTDGNGCTNTSASANITVNARPTGVLSGTTTICGVGSTSLSIAATGSGAISGTLNPGAIAYSGTAPLITVSVSPGALTNYSIATMSDANCSSIAGDLTGGATVSVYTLSTAPTSITSNAVNNQICTGNSILLTANGGAFGNAPGASYKWYEGGCGTGAALGSAATLSLTPTLGSHTYYARIEDACGNTNCASLTVLVTAATQLNSIHYTASIADGCVGAPSATFSVNAVAGCTFYNWTSAQAGVRFNGNPSPYQTTVPTVNITFVSLPAAGASGWSICVTGGNPCGITNTICAWVRSTVSAPTSVIGSKIGCPGTSGNNYSSTAVAGAVSYQWSSTGGIVVTGNGSQAITAAFPGGFVSGTLSVRGQTACGSQGPNRTITITANPAIPGTITGPSYPCPNASASYSIAAVQGAANYQWTTSVPGAVVTGTTTSCSIAFPATIPAGSTVSVVAKSSCPTSSPVRSKGIATGLLGVPSAISGPASGQCGATGVSYTINPVANATGYFWTASCGVIQGSNTLSGLTINWPGSFTSCILTVSANNSCGSGAARTLSVSGAPATPAVVSGQAAPCIGAFETYNASSSGATSYNWTVPAGSVILGPVNGGTILLQWGSTSGNVSAQAVNACGVSGFRALACVISCRQSQVTGSASGFNAEVYPNPATEKATVKFTATTAAQYHLNMTDVIGRNVLSTDGTATEGINMVDLDLNNLTKGVYMLNIKSGGDSAQISVVVE